MMLGLSVSLILWTCVVTVTANSLAMEDRTLTTDTEFYAVYFDFKSTLSQADHEFNGIMRLSQKVQRLSSSIAMSSQANPYTTVNPQELYVAHNDLKSTLSQADQEFNGIMRLSQKVQRLSSSIGISSQENPYTTVNPQELYVAHNDFKSTLSQADQEFNGIMRLSQKVQRLSSSIGISSLENPYTTVNPQVLARVIYLCNKLHLEDCTQEIVSCMMLMNLANKLNKLIATQ